MSGKKVTVRKQKIKKNHIREKLIFFTILTLILLIVAAVARKLCPYDPYAQDLLLAQKPPGPEHILGSAIPPSPGGKKSHTVKAYISVWEPPLYLRSVLLSLLTLIMFWRIGDMPSSIPPMSWQ